MENGRVVRDRVDIKYHMLTHLESYQFYYLKNKKIGYSSNEKCIRAGHGYFSIFGVSRLPRCPSTNLL